MFVLKSKHTELQKKLAYVSKQFIYYRTFYNKNKPKRSNKK